MATGKQSAWWREMGAISRGMMFLDGGIATPASAEALSETQEADGQQAREPLPSGPDPSGIVTGVVRLLEDLALLGGRPVGVRHNDDIDEPFPPLHRRSKALARRAHRIAQVDCATC